MENESSVPGAIGAAALWEQFTNHLRAGRMKEAYACFGPHSQEVFSFADFCKHYSPLTAASEATLSPIDQGQLQLMGDVARLRYLGASRSPLSNPNRTAFADLAPEDELLEPDPQNTAGVFVTALLVREDGSWHLVAAAREAVARTEAETRNLLREMWRMASVQQARRAGLPLQHEELIAGADALFRSAEARFCLESYRFALKDSGEGLALLALPVRDGPRAFGIRKERRAVAPEVADPVPEFAGATRSELHDEVLIPPLPGHLGDSPTPPTAERRPPPPAIAPELPSLSSVRRRAEPTEPSPVPEMLDPAVRKQPEPTPEVAPAPAPDRLDLPPLLPSELPDPEERVELSPAPTPPISGRTEAVSATDLPSLPSLPTLPPLPDLSADDLEQNPRGIGAPPVRRAVPDRLPPVPGIVDEAEL